jgi:glycosyltransferase involved in cell wall biosynthesis
MNHQESASNTTPKIICIIPAHNEDRFIASVVHKARRHVDVVLVIDDGSTDETAWLAQTAGAQVIRQPNGGKASALNTGMTAARSMNPRVVVLIDGDGQQDPNDIPLLMEAILAGEADLVVGSRFVGNKSNTPKWRILGQQALTTATNIASGVALTDSQSGFRALSPRALDAFHFRTAGFSVESEMQFLIREHGLVAAEVPIVVNYDEGPKRNPVTHGLQVVRGISRMVHYHRPLFFFGVPGALSTLAGLYLGLRVVEAYREFAALAVGTALIAITLCIAGLITFFTGVILQSIRTYMRK